MEEDGEDESWKAEAVFDDPDHIRVTGYDRLSSKMIKYLLIASPTLTCGTC